MEVNPGDNPILALFLMLLLLAGCTAYSVTSGPQSPVSVGPQVEVSATTGP
jgi:hypothetical protein